MSCSTYIKSLPTFPDVKILKVYFPFEAEPNEIIEWTVWANSAADSLQVDTYYNSKADYINKILLTQKNKFYHAQSPVSGIRGDWAASIPGKYELKIKVWNKWSSDTSYRFITIKKTILYE